MTKQTPLTFDQVNELLAYDPDTGIFTWKTHLSRSFRAGDRAGSLKTQRIGRDGRAYKSWYVAIRGFQTPAARVAWLLSYGEWPNGNIVFIDGDSENIRLSNLRLRDESLYAHPLPKSGETRVPRVMSKEAQRKYGLVRYYGEDAPEIVDRLFVEQKGLCALCSAPGGHPAGPDPKGVLHTDHDHTTQEIRSLLCFNCNAMLGSSRDNPALLRAAADYIERHRKGGDNVVPLKPEAG